MKHHKFVRGRACENTIMPYMCIMNLMTVIFAGGCFWCMQPEFDNAPGVTQTTVGYTGGESTAPTYENHKGHVEAIQVTYDPEKTNYNALLQVYWRNIDPFDDNGQFADRGGSYKTVIFYANEDEKNIAEESKQALAKKFNRAIATEIRPRMPFYAAEDYHQKYYEKNATRYNMYKYGSGRVDTLKQIWDK